MTEKLNLSRLSDHYLAALRIHLSEGPSARLQPALLLGREAVGLGLETLEFARIHERAVAALELPTTLNATLKRAEKFFSEANSSIKESHCASRPATVHLSRLKATLGQRTAELAATNRELKRGFVRKSASRSFPVIAMAASTGGLKALSVILAGLPADFPAAIAIVMHLSPAHKSILAEILSRRTHLKVKQAHTGDRLCHSCAFVAPPNRHLSVARGGQLKLSSSSAEKVHHARPSAEPLFASVAAIYKTQAIAVVLTGGDGDGSFGVQIIKDKGGKVIAQDRPTSEDFSMPESSIKTGDVDFILPLDEIASKLIELVNVGSGPKNGRTTSIKRTPTPAVAEFATPNYSAGTKAAILQRMKISA